MPASWTSNFFSFFFPLPLFSHHPMLFFVFIWHFKLLLSLWVWGSDSQSWIWTYKVNLISGFHHGTTQSANLDVWVRRGRSVTFDVKFSCICCSQCQLQSSFIVFVNLYASVLVSEAPDVDFKYLIFHVSMESLRHITVQWVFHLLVCVQLGCLTLYANCPCSWRPNVGSFALEKDESGSKRCLHWLWRSVSTQWQNPDIVAWLPGSTLHSYFVYQAVTSAVLWHPFGCRFKSCRVGIRGFKSNSFSFCPVISPSCNCFTHKPIWCKHYIVSCHKLMLNCWDSVVFSDKNCTIQWALLIYHWWLCAICFQKSTC